MTSFNHVTSDQIAKVLGSMNPKSCELDPIPTWLLKKCPAANGLLSIIINWSLENAMLPLAHKIAHVRPRLKKSSLDAEKLKNFRPVSNLSLISKLVEKFVAAQLSEHCDENDISLPLQSAYKACHSTETAMVKVVNDLQMAVDRDGGAVLVLLDLSAAFDTLDHQLILQNLEHQIGLNGTALTWFESYLANRKQLVKIGSASSQPKDLTYGVPQGSVLWPTLFSLYTRPLSTIIENTGMGYHLYADDSQLYISIKVRSPASVSSVQGTISRCTTAIQEWMSTNFLKLNGDKTELLIVTKPSLTQYAPSSLNILGEVIKPSEKVTDLGVVLDSIISLSDHVKHVCAKAYYQLYLIKKVRPFITEDAARHFTQTNVTSYLDYCNALLAGSPAYLFSRLQHVQNCAARVVKRADRRTPSLPLLKELHWLPIKFRVRYKVNVMTFKALHGLSPPYIASLITPYVPNHYRLRSTDQHLLTTPRYNLKSFGYRTFYHQAPSLWNSLPLTLRSENSLTAFKSKLKTHYFTLAF